MSYEPLMYINFTTCFQGDVYVTGTEILHILHRWSCQKSKCQKITEGSSQFLASLFNTQLSKKLNYLSFWLFSIFLTTLMFKFLCKQVAADFLRKAALKNGDAFLEKFLSTWKSKLIENRIITVTPFLMLSSKFCEIKYQSI